MHKWEGGVQTLLLYCGVCRLRLWGSGFDGGFSFFCVCFLLKFLPLPSHPLSSNVLAKFYIASSCCVILNQWALILLLKHCGLYWGKNKKKPVTFKAVFFFLRGGRRVGCGSGGTLPLPFSLLWRKKKSEIVCNWNTKLWLLMLFFFFSS